MFVLPCDARFYRIPDARRRVAAVEAVDRDDSGRGSDVDLGQIAPDDVDPDEHQAAAFQFGADGVANLPFALRELGRFGGPAGGEVGSDFARTRPAVDCASEFAI